MKDTVHERIKQFLREKEVEHRSVHHEPTFTSEESAKARGENISTGGKALLMKVSGEFKLFVISAAKKSDSKKIKAYFGVKKLRFATKEELLELTGLVPGSVPPFGEPIFPFGLYVDTSITENESIAFNAGSLTDSIIMSVADYVRVAEPAVFDFSQD